MMAIVLGFQIEKSSKEERDWRVSPALTGMMESGITPKKVPMRNRWAGIPTWGEVMLMNQFGRSGVIRRKRM